MSSKAAVAFRTRTSDVERLMEIHKAIAGATVGKKVGVDVLNRSAIVLLTAAWEGYVEDLAREAIDHVVAYAPDESLLPKRLRKLIADELKSDAHDLAVWRLAGHSWRTLLQARLGSGAITHFREFNSPASGRVRGLFDEACGLADVTSHWRWQNMTPQDAADKVDALVSLRNDIAHGAGAQTPVHKPRVLTFRKHVDNLVSHTDGAVRAHLLTVTNVPLF